MSAYVLKSFSLARADARFAFVTTVSVCVFGSTFPVFMNVAQAIAPNAACCGQFWSKSAIWVPFLSAAIWSGVTFQPTLNALPACPRP